MDSSCCVFFEQGATVTDHRSGMGERDSALCIVLFSVVCEKGFSSHQSSLFALSRELELFMTKAQ